MDSFDLAALPDSTLLHDLNALVAVDRLTVARVLAHIAEIDRRRLYASVGYSSMFAYCVEQLGFSEETAYMRIEVARKARECPVLFHAIADGRLHFSGARMLLPHLSSENVEDLISGAAHRTRREIEIWLANRFPKAEALRLDEGISAQKPLPPSELVPVPVGELVPVPVQEPIRPRVIPLAEQRFSIQLTVPKRAHDKLMEVRAILRHAVPSGDLAEVFERALDALLLHVAQRKLGATHRTRKGVNGASRGRYIPARVKREVWERDGGRCTFVGNDGHRCEETEFLEFDHIQPVAKGGKPTADNLRLRCRTHNRLEAVRQFGEDFMKRKEEQTKDEIGKDD